MRLDPRRAALGAAFVAAGCATPQSPPADVARLADQYVMQSFAAGPGQELGRLQQDQTQKDCTATRANPPAALAAAIMAREAGNIAYPADGKLMGDWKAGQKVFNDGFAFRVGSFIPSPANAVRGGNCYACHEGEAREVAFGNLGPSLRNYGKLRGQGDAVVKYTYEKIYNARAFNACSAMPRLGHHKILSPAQVADLTAFLVSAESPLNR